ncbi:MAG TPA: DUF6350 family protein [Pseudonocardiaceae bacterium]
MTAIQTTPPGVPHSALEPEPDRRGERVRALLIAAVGPLFAGYTAAATLVTCVASAAPGGDYSIPAVLRASGPVWLAAHHIPLSIGGSPLGALPLLPTLAVVLVLARSAVLAAARLQVRRPEEAGPVVAVMALAHAVFGAVLAGLSGDGPMSADPATAFFGCGLVAAGAATLGVAGRSGLLRRARRTLHPATLLGFRVAALAVAGLLAVGAALTTLGLLLSLNRVREVFAATAPDTGSAFGLLLLSVLYLPNALVAGASFAAGPGLQIGTVVIGPFHTELGALPPVPLLAALPSVPQERWWATACLAPLAVGVLVGWAFRDVHRLPRARWRVVSVGAVVTTVVFFVLTTLAGGRLGNGVFDPVAMPPGLVAAAVFGWIWLPATVVVWLCGPRPRRVRRSRPAQATTDTTDTEDAADGTQDRTGTGTADAGDGVGKADEHTGDGSGAGADGTEADDHRPGTGENPPESAATGDTADPEAPGTSTAPAAQPAPDDTSGEDAASDTAEGRTDEPAEDDVDSAENDAQPDPAPADSAPAGAGPRTEGEGKDTEDDAEENGPQAGDTAGSARTAQERNPEGR